MLDESWLKSNPTPEISVANREAVPAVLVPKLSTFVVASLNFYKDFVGFAKSKLQELAKYQSQYHLADHSRTGGRNRQIASCGPRLDLTNAADRARIESFPVFYRFDEEEQPFVAGK